MKDLSDVGIAFNQQLARIYNPSTQTPAVEECIRLINENSSNRQMVRIVIGALTDKDLTNSKTSYSANNALGFHASLFGRLAFAFKDDMIDPIDKPATRLNTW